MNCIPLRFSFLLTLGLLWSFTLPLAAQEDRITEEEVNEQKVFIEANREKILGNYENAAYLYKEVLKKDGKNHAAYYELARIHDVLDQNQEALKAIQQAIKYDNTNSWYRMFLGDVYEKSGDYDDAAKVYDALTKEDPNQDYYYYKMAYYLVKAKDAAKAIKVYDELEKKIGITEEVCMKKHRLYLGLGNSKKAASELQKLIDAYPSEMDYRHALATFYEQITEMPKAQEEYQRILELDPSDARAKMALVGFLKEGGSDVAYLQSLKPIFQKADMDIDVKIKELIPYIQKVAQSGDKELAAAGIELAEILEEVHPQQAKSFSAFGDLLYYSGDAKAALSKYQKALKLDDTVFPIWEQVMYIALETNDLNVLEEYATDAIDLFPNQAKAYYFKGIAKSEKQEYANAINEFEQALLMSRKNPQLQFDLYQRLGITYFQTRDYEKSDKAFEDALALNAKDASLLNTYSFYLAARGVKLEKAKEMASLSNELVPNQATYQDTYGWILYQLKDYTASKDWLGKALSNGGDKNPVILEHYGDLLFQMNDKENAIRYWQKAVEQGGQSESLLRKIADGGGKEQ